jgi:hypothetical protein
MSARSTSRVPIISSKTFVIYSGTPGSWLAAALTSNKKKRNALQVGREMKKEHLKVPQCAIISQV